MATPTRYRDLQAPILPQVMDMDDGGAAAARALSDTLSAFERTGAGVIGQMRSQQGAREGEAAGAAGQPAPRTGLRATTAYGQAYNTAAEAAYSSKVQVDIDATLDRLEQENEANLEGYTAASAGYSQEMLKNAPPEYRTRVEQALAVRTQAGGTRVRGQQITREREEQLAAVIAGIDARANLAISAAETMSREEGDAALFAAAADNDAQIDALVADLAVDPVTAEKLKAAFRQTLDEGLFGARVGIQVDNLMNAAKTDVLKGDRMLGALMADETIPAEDKAAIRQSYDQQRTALGEDRSRQFVQQNVALAQRLAADEFGPGVMRESERLYRLGAKSDAEYASDISKATENEGKYRGDSALENAALAALEGGRGLDPANPEQRKALNVLVDRAVAASNMVPGDERWTQAMVDVARKTNILPDQAETFARVNILSGDPTQAALGAAFFARVQDSNPVAWDYNSDPKIASFATQLNQNVAGGITPERAYELAFRNVYGLKEEEKAILRVQYSASKKNLAENYAVLRDVLDDDEKFDPSVWVSSPETTLQIQGEYDNLVGQYYVSTNGDVQAARKLAAKVVQSQYGVTEMNGKREIMKYAPEHMYPGLTASIIRTDLGKALTSVGVELQPGQEARIVPNRSTEFTRGREWDVGIYDEDGNYDVVRGKDNRPLPYALPLGEDFTVLHEAAKAAQIVEAQIAAEAAKKRDELYGDLRRYQMDDEGRR